MKLLNIFIVCLVLLWGTTVLADPPACPPEQGVCFEAMMGEVFIFGEDPVSGAYVEGTFEADHNDFDRFNKDGTIYTHMIVNEITSGLYCPPGSMYPNECWPVDLSLPSGGSVTGIVVFDPPWFYYSCPYRARATAYVTDPMGDLYKVTVSLIMVPSPDGGCDIVKYEVKLKP